MIRSTILWYWFQHFYKLRGGQIRSVGRMNEKLDFAFWFWPQREQDGRRSCKKGENHESRRAHRGCLDTQPQNRGRYGEYLCGGGGLVAKSCLTLSIPWTLACQAPLSMGFSRQGYWTGLPFPSPGDLPNPGSNLGLLYCRQILYQLSFEGSPNIYISIYIVWLLKRR